MSFFFFFWLLAFGFCSFFVASFFFFLLTWVIGQEEGRNVHKHVGKKEELDTFCLFFILFFPITIFFPPFLAI